MRKSTATTRNYRPGTLARPVSLSSFRDQMADYARAERLRELRDAVHMSREKVAAEIGVTTKTLYAWENGGSIRWENAKKLGEFYGVDPEGLVSREPHELPVHLNGNGPDEPAYVQDLRNELTEVKRMLENLARAIEGSSEAVEARIEESETKLTRLLRAPGQGHRRAG